MRIKKYGKALAVGAAAAALAIGASTAAFAAATTYTVEAGSAADGTTVTFSAHTIDNGAPTEVTFTDETTGTVLTCESATADQGSTTVNPGQPGDDIADIAGDQTTWTTCLGPFNLAFTVQGSGTWHLNANGPTTNGVTQGSISNVTANVSDPGVCTFTVTGSVGGSYDNNTQVLSLPGNTQDLTISNVNGCISPLIIGNGDQASFKADYQVGADNPSNDPITITSD